MTFSGVASNFAGDPARARLHLHAGHARGSSRSSSRTSASTSDAGDFTIFSKLGLEIVYLYFQFPLMVLIIAPAIDGLRPEWREAAENMGATGTQYWRRVALPILTPTLLGSMILLFGNAFGAQATAYQLTGGQVPLVPLADRQPDQRRRPAQRRARLRHGDGDGRHHGRLDPRLHAPPATSGALAAMSGTPARRGDRASAAAPARRAPTTSVGTARPRRERRRGFGAPWAWIVFIIGVPLLRRPAGRHVPARRCGRSRPSRPTPTPSPTRASSRASATRSSSASSRSSFSIGADRPDRVLGPAARAAAAPGRRVHHAPAVRHPAGRPRVRADPDLQPAAAAADQHGHRQQRAAGVRLRRPVAAVHVPRGRLRAAARSTSGA